MSMGNIATGIMEEVAFELDFERLSDLPDQQFLGPCADGKLACE